MQRPSKEASSHPEPLDHVLSASHTAVAVGVSIRLPLDHRKPVQGSRTVPVGRLSLTSLDTDVGARKTIGDEVRCNGQQTYGRHR